VKQERSLAIPIDLIRTIAIIGVILLHATNDLTIQHLNQLEIIRWCTVDIYQSFGRMGAPLFVLVTGALLLQPSKDENISVFFKKRWARIGVPFIFWGAAYFLWDFFVLKHAITWDAIIQGILKGPYYQFWYLYMLVGLYLLTPILRIVIAYAERKILRYFVIIWFLGASIAPFVALLTSYSLDGNVLTLTGWVGYFVLGTYLLGVRMRRSTLWALLIVSLALTAIGTYWLAATIGGGTTYFFQEYFSPTMIIASVTFFLLLNTIQSPTSQKETNQKEIAPKPISQPKTRKLLKLISENTLPLFLFHEIILESLQKGYFGITINGNTINSIIGVPLITVITLFICLAIIVPLKKVPVLKKLIG
jgi:surface polysaccharide O-acyltransferase-like enzyme